MDELITNEDNDDTGLGDFLITLSIFVSTTILYVTLPHRNMLMRINGV